MRASVIFIIFSTAVMGLPNPSPNNQLVPVCKNNHAHYLTTTKSSRSTSGKSGSGKSGSGKSGSGKSGSSESPHSDSSSKCILIKQKCEEHTHCDRQGRLAVSSAPDGCGHDDVEKFCVLENYHNKPQCSCAKGA